MNRFFKLATLALGLTAIVLAGSMPQASAQGGTKVRRDMLEKTRWNQSPREYQIIADSPVVRGFREAPQQAQTIDLPPAPGAGPVGGNGGGALGGGPGSSIPGGGIPLGKGGGYRTAPSQLGGMQSLPKS